MTKSNDPTTPIVARGFHFYRDGRKWLAKGVTYGPFRPDSDGNAYPPEERLVADFDAMAAIGVNTVRLYTLPTDLVAQRAAERGLQLLVDVSWPKHLDVYGKPALERMGFDMVEEAVKQTARWPNVLGLMIGNEIPADIVRWVKPRRVEDFLRRLYARAKSLAPERLVGFANFPSTEFLQLHFFDFLGFNVYLENRSDLERYLHRLRHLYPETPLLLSETGLDSRSNGEEEQARVLDFSLKAAFAAGMAGTLVFSWTDEWHTGGYDINQWRFGLLDRERRPKAAFEVVRDVFRSAPRCLPPAKTPYVSVIVATYNGAATLAECLRSLKTLHYPSYEVVVVDDGSTDATPAILQDFPYVRVFTQKNKGLSAARNAGIAFARGEIVAFLDSDCVADPDWLHHLVRTMTSEPCGGAGGPNLTPWESRPLHRTVAYAPGHATHVLLDLREAEHVPGCNMAFWRSALIEAGSFDPRFRKAGDDVDAIWRLQDKGERILFSPAAFVWHHRRSSIGAYLRQQMGYGEAEALLAGKHPHRFNDRGQSLWRGVIYSGQELQPLFKPHDIHFGVFGSAGFQCIYERRAGFLSHFLTSFEWWGVCSILLVSGLLSPWALLASLLGGGASVAVSGLKAWRSFGRARDLPTRYFPMVWLLWVLQPLVRGWKRYVGAFVKNSPSAGFRRAVAEALPNRRLAGGLALVLEYWGEKAPDRLSVLREISDSMTRRGWLHSPNTGWEPWDLTVVLSQWFRCRLTSAEEDHGEGKRLLRLRLSLTPTSLSVLLAFAGLLTCSLIFAQDSVLARIVAIGLILAGWLMYRDAIKAQSTVASAFDSLLQEADYIAIAPNAQRTPLSPDSPLASGTAARTIQTERG